MFLEHLYGGGVNIVADPFQALLLAKLCADETKQPAVNRYVNRLAQYMTNCVMARELPIEVIEQPTRMQSHTGRGVFKGEVTKASIKVVVTTIARAGINPSLVCFDTLNEYLIPDEVRQDHMSMERIVVEGGGIKGSRVSGAKIGGSMEGVYQVILDPMGATGATFDNMMRHHEQKAEGTPAKVIAIFFIVTPECIKFMRENYPQVIIYALRVDRGMSSDDILATVPGTDIEKEIGLIRTAGGLYIVPGGGGFGEIMNNSFPTVVVEGA